MHWKNHSNLNCIYRNNNNNGFRVRFGVRRRHRGPPFALGHHQFIILVAIQGEGEGEGGYTSRVGYFHVSVRVKKKDYGGKRCIFNEERNKGKVGQDRNGRGREFQMDGAANEKERRPFADRISGIVRRNLSMDLKFLVGI